MSWGFEKTASSGHDLADALQKLIKANFIPIVAAGNDGVSDTISIFQMFCLLVGCFNIFSCSLFNHRKIISIIQTIYIESATYRSFDLIIDDHEAYPSLAIRRQHDLRLLFPSKCERSNCGRQF